MQTLGVSILSTDLAATDRRALSEAWYGALHLTAATPRSRAAAPRDGTSAHGAACADRTPARKPKSSSASRAAAGDAPARGRGRATSLAPRALPAPADERRIAPAPLARSLRAAIVATADRSGASRVTIGDRSGRVLVTVQTSGGRTRVVAICTPALRDAVERALAHARFALADRLCIEAA